METNIFFKMSRLDTLKARVRPLFRTEPASVRHLMACKSLAWGNNVMNRIAYGNLRVIAQSGLRRLSEKRAENVFVFANGPSLNDLDFRKVKALVDSRRFDLITVNSFASGGITKFDITPTAAVFGDPYHHIGDAGTGLCDEAVEDIRVINERGVPAIVPNRYYAKSRFKDSIPYCGSYNPYGSNVSNILNPLGFYSVTAFVALSLALHLGHQNIFICGYDNSYFKDFEVDRENRMFLHDLHFYDALESPKRYMDSDQFGPTSHIFLDVARHFAYLEKINRLKPHGVRVFNIALKTFTAAFERRYDLDIYKVPV